MKGRGGGPRLKVLAPPGLDKAGGNARWGSVLGGDGSSGLFLPVFPGFPKEIILVLPRLGYSSLSRLCVCSSRRGGRYCRVPPLCAEAGRQGSPGGGDMGLGTWGPLSLWSLFPALTGQIPFPCLSFPLCKKGAVTEQRKSEKFPWFDELLRAHSSV